jgi:hypothetical protein
MPGSVTAAHHNASNVPAIIHAPIAGSTPYPRFHKLTPGTAKKAPYIILRSQCPRISLHQVTIYRPFVNFLPKGSR